MSNRLVSAKSRSATRGSNPAKHTERLETRTMLSVAINSAGWTVITPEAGDRVIYCSNSTGNDSNSGLSPSSPVKSITAGTTLLRGGHGDELLLKAGDVWQGNITWRLSGASTQDPMVLGSYGSGARPTVLSGNSAGLNAGSSSGKVVNFLSIEGIRFDASARDPALTSNVSRNDPTGINVLSQSTGILIENCEIQNYYVNINLQDYFGPISNVSIRRNVVLNSWSSDAHSQGLYATGVNGLSIQGNYFDHNGWNPLISGANATWFNHDCYISGDNANCVVINNTFADAAAYGLQARSGGIVENNVFINDAVGMSFGIVNGASTTPGGVTGIVSGNVFIGGASVGGIVQGNGMIVGNIKPGAGAVISNNIFTQSVNGAAAAIDLSFGKTEPNPQASVGINDLKISNNTFYNWTIGIDAEGGMTPGGTGITAFNRVSISGNQFENVTTTSIENHQSNYAAQETITSNVFYNANTFLTNGVKTKAVGTVMSTPLIFAQPNRSIATYAASLGLGNTPGLMAQIATQSQQTYNPQYDATAILTYLDAGFGLTPLPPITPPITTSSVPTITVTDNGGVYSGAAFGATGSVFGNSNTYLGTPTFRYYLASDTNFTSALSGPPTNIGNYVVIASYAGNGTYTAASATASFAITSPGTTPLIKPIIQVTDSGGIYTGSAFAASGSVTGVNNVNLGTPTFHYYLASDTAFANRLTGAPAEIGNYIVVASFPGSGTYAAVSAQAAFSITAGPTVTPVRSASGLIQALSYDDTLGNPDSASSNGAWVEYKGLNFGSTGLTQFDTAAVAAIDGQAGSIQIRLDSPNGKVVGSLTETPTGGLNIYTLQSTGVGKITGAHNVYLVFSGGAVISNLQWFLFH